MMGLSKTCNPKCTAQSRSSQYASPILAARHQVMYQPQGDVTLCLCGCPWISQAFKASCRGYSIHMHSGERAIAGVVLVHHLTRGLALKLEA